MKPTEILMNEHRVIEQVLDCLEAIAERGEATGSPDTESARQAIAFFRSFADTCHHGKEENHLFLMMEAKGLPRIGGPTGVMLHEHDQGRGHIQAMEGALDKMERGGSSEGVEQFLRHARGYVNLLREHIHKEDHCLFPMADRVFESSDQNQLMEAFIRVEEQDIGLDVHEKFLKVADELAERFGATKAFGGPEGSTGKFACGHHPHS
jgi:hemerythrin-like domain-containing protein